MDSQYIDIYIDGVKLPTPSTFEVEYSDMDVDSLRLLTTAKLKRNRVRADIQKVKIGYLLKDVPAIDKIMKMLKHENINVKIYDNSTGTVVNKEMYASNKSFAYIRVKRGIKGQGFKFSLTEY